MIITINQLERNVSDDVVVAAYWEATLTEGEYQATTSGIASFVRDDKSNSLISFEDLTEADVIGWLILDDRMEARLQSQIDEERSPSTVFGVPWNNNVNLIP